MGVKIFMNDERTAAVADSSTGIISRGEQQAHVLVGRVDDLPDECIACLGRKTVDERMVGTQGCGRRCSMTTNQA